MDENRFPLKSRDVYKQRSRWEPEKAIIFSCYDQATTHSQAGIPLKPKKTSMKLETQPAIQKVGKKFET